MLVKSISAAVSITLLSVAAAQAQPARVKQFDAWGVYSYESGGRKHCYALSVPTSSQPASVNHGDNFFIVAPQGSGAVMPQAIMGYDLRSTSDVTVSIDGNRFDMQPKDNAAWVRNKDREPAMVTAMRGGASMSLSATSARGTNTQYSYSLSGVTAALNEANRCN
ncbi:invasion protein IalB [Neorhizobium huautlense]|uniref:Invasion protein IalB n=1 Tax=Neorhizobium huautlense TaxID=67774 RepID=A0ABT9PYM4_9HYPH|nr:invasion associated locus B family protein [Neorhizobium huautlense]MDP9839527.1 invasion protein IalB [Neorhizobium huautlense]